MIASAIRGWRTAIARRSVQVRSNTTTTDPICEMAASNLRFGKGSTAEVGLDLRDGYFARRVVVFTDQTIRKLKCMDVVMDSLEHNQLDVTVYDSVRVEPNDESFKDAITFLTNHEPYDAIVAIGGGSVLDTAKAANLYATLKPDDFYDYVNPPLGKGKPISPHQRLPPLIAIPTTAGTGSETTGVAIFDDSPTKSKTGIAHRSLKPSLGIIDPDNTKTLPAEVAKYSGLDVLCHAIESYTALPSTQRIKPKSPLHRPAYQGSNPISDIWSLYALKTAATWLEAAIFEGNEEARTQMLLASSAAGIGFGNAGVHLCHGMSYPIASQVKSYRPERGYNGVDHPIVPHGLSVIVNAPSVFRFTAPSNPHRHAQCAHILATARLGEEPPMRGNQDAGKWLADEIIDLCNRLDVPMGIRTFGYDEDDIPNLVEGTLPQHRVLSISPRSVERKDLEGLFLDALDAYKH